MGEATKAPTESRATIADLLAIPEPERRHELIDGEIVDKGAATGEHGATQADLVTALNRRFGRRPGGRWPGGWWSAIEVEIVFDGTQLFRPDVVGWRRERVSQRPRGIPIEVLPDWICEILSSNRRHDLIKKKRTYHRCQVPHYWIIDPAEETVAVHRWSADGYIEVLAAQRGERVRAEPFEAVELEVGTFFGDDDPDDG
ncbi:MAG: Uma2 family endonuclease [Myxococcota bacterium]